MQCRRSGPTTLTADESGIQHVPICGTLSIFGNPMGLVQWSFTPLGALSPIKHTWYQVIDTTCPDSSSSFVDNNASKFCFFFCRGSTASTSMANRHYTRWTCRSILCVVEYNAQEPVLLLCCGSVYRVLYFSEGLLIA